MKFTCVDENYQAGEEKELVHMNEESAHLEFITSLTSTHVDKNTHGLVM